MSETPRPRASRRAALGGVLVGLTATGCDAFTSSDPPPGPVSSAPPSDPPEDPDAALVERVRRRVGEAAVLCRAAADRRRSLATELRRFERLHRRHLAALPGGGQLPGRPRVHGDAASLRGRVGREEHALQTFLADAAVTAQSGPLAVMLASMSAAVAQQLAVRGTGRR